MTKTKPADIIIGQDTREQAPYDFSLYGLSVERVALPYGDYTLLYPDLRREVVIERKNIDDLTQCCGNWRDRFERELLALRGYKYAYVVGEFSYQDILGHCYTSKIHPHSVIGSIATWSSWGINFCFLDDRQVATYFVASLLRNLAAIETGRAKECCQAYQYPLDLPKNLTSYKVRQSQQSNKINSVEYLPESFEETYANQQ